jgi:hypothetical protein
MAERDRIRALIEGLGPNDHEIAAIAQNGDAEWAVAYHGDPIVVLDLVESRAELVLSAAVGRPAPERRLEVYESMLTYNLLWPATGGIKMGLGAADGDLVQMVELSTVGLDRERLRAVLRDFVEKARIWRRVIAGAPQGAADRGAPVVAGRTVRP